MWKTQPVTSSDSLQQNLMPQSLQWGSPASPKSPFGDLSSFKSAFPSLDPDNPLNPSGLRFWGKHQHDDPFADPKVEDILPDLKTTGTATPTDVSMADVLDKIHKSVQPTTTTARDGTDWIPEERDPPAEKPVEHGTGGYGAMRHWLHRIRTCPNDATLNIKTRCDHI
jgi:hypothetical protein